MGFGFLGKFPFPFPFHRLSVSRQIQLSSPAAMAKSHLPDRWTKYTPVGKRIPGTRFIAFKVPLKKMYDGKLQTCQRFAPSDLLREIEKQNEKLGLILDLTCTTRYYSPQELPRNLIYNKIFTAGKQIPSDKVYHEFKSIVNDFLRNNSENDKLVGVHCTHGLNRTGYLVCRYLIDVIGMEPSEAIEKFNQSRGHCMERNNYLDDLLCRKPKEPEISTIPSSAGLDRPSVPQARHQQQHTSERSFHSSQGWRAPPCGPRLPAPAFSHPPMHQAPRPQHIYFPDDDFLPRSGPVMPARHLPHAQGPRYDPQLEEGIQPRQSSHTLGNPRPYPRTPAQNFPGPYVPGPRHGFQQMDSNPHFRGGPNRFKHHKMKPFSQQGEGADEGFPQQNGVDVMNGFPVQAFAQHLPNKKNCNKRGRGAHSGGQWGHGQSRPY